MKHYGKIGLCIASLLATSHAISAPALDTRSLGMGGTGVTSSNYLTAPFHNPAMAAHSGEYDFAGILAPYASVVLNDKDGIIVDAADLATTLIDIDEGVEINGEVVGDIANYIVDLKGAQFYTEAGAGVSFAIPNQYLSVGAFVQGYTSVTGFMDISTADSVFAQRCAQEWLDNPDGVGVSTECSDGDEFAERLNSQAITAGVAVIDAGVTLAMPFNINTRRDHGRNAKNKSYEELFHSDKLYVGVTPKYQHVSTVSYGRAINQFDCETDIEHPEIACQYLEKTYENFTNSEGDVNVDLGIAYENYAYNVTVGLSAKNLLEREMRMRPLVIYVPGTYQPLKTILGKYKIHPVYTAGVSWTNGFATLAADLDLNETENISRLIGMYNEFDPDSDNFQMLKVGTELNFYWAQIRAGVSHDLKSNINTMMSLGLGLSPLNLLHLDIGVTSDLESSFGISAQTTFTF